MDELEIFEKLKADKADFKNAYLEILKKNNLLEEKLRFFMNELENQKAYTKSVIRKMDNEIKKVVGGSIEAVRNSQIPNSDALIQEINQLTPLRISDDVADAFSKREQYPKNLSDTESVES